MDGEGSRLTEALATLLTLEGLLLGVDVSVERDADRGQTQGPCNLLPLTSNLKNNPKKPRPVFSKFLFYMIIDIILYLKCFGAPVERTLGTGPCQPPHVFGGIRTSHVSVKCL